MEHPSKDSIKSNVERILTAIRKNYLQARPPQQIPELVNLFQTGKEDKNELATDETKLVSKGVLLKLHTVTVDFSQELEYESQRNVGTTENCKRSESFTHPPIQYRTTFAKHLIKQLESLSGHEQSLDLEDEGSTLELWYDLLERLSSSGQTTEPFYRLYEIKHDKQNELVKIFENETSFVADGTTGLVTWKAAIEFVNWLNLKGTNDMTLDEGYRSLMNCKWILELGCGCGFLVVAVTKFLQSTLEKYIATDGSLAALEKAKENVEANFSKIDTSTKSKVSFEKVDWENESTIESFSQLVDGMTSIYGTDSGVLLGTDIIFDPSQVPALVELIHDFLEKRSGSVLLSCTIRNPETMKAFVSEIDRIGLTIRICWKWEDGEIIQIMPS